MARTSPGARATVDVASMRTDVRIGYLGAGGEVAPVAVLVEVRAGPGARRAHWIVGPPRAHRPRSASVLLVAAAAVRREARRR